MPSRFRARPKGFFVRRQAFLLAALTASTVLIALSAPTAASAEAPDPGWATCSQQTVSVTVSATDPTPYNVVGRLCLSNDAMRGMKTVEMFVSGLTYDHNYFNVSYLPNIYSHVYAATSRGYSTFNYDRLGVGLSDHPPAEKLTLQSHAYVAAQIVQRLRSGIGGRAFTTVVGVGHSFGAAILQYLAGTATVAATVPDYLVLSSFLFATYTPGLTALGNALYTATSDPAFASSGLPSGYITTMPNTRGPLFYYTAGVEPAMVTLDEATKQLGTLGERSTLGAARNTAVTLNVKVPVLITVGQFDRLYCDEASGLSCADANAVKTREAPNFGARACLKTYVLPNAGHSAALHVKAPELFNYVHSWLDNYTVNYLTAKDANGCLLWIP